MSVRHNSALVPAPAAAVRAAAREGRGFAAAGIGLDLRGPLADGDSVWISSIGPCRVHLSEDAIALSSPRLRYELTLQPAPEGTVLRGRAYGRRIAAAGLRAHADWIRREVARRVPVIVGGAAVRDGRLLAAQRTYPSSAAGRYELPGGKVEPGEPARAALMREWREELGVEVLTGSRVGPDVVVGRRVLRIWRVRITAGEPEPREHAQLRWVPGRELADLDWLPADRALLTDLRALLRP